MRQAFARPLGGPPQEVHRQFDNVVTPLPQWRQDDANHVEPIEQVFAKASLRDQRFQVLVRGGDQADVDLDRLVPPHRFELPLLQHPQQLDLRLERDVANLVEEQRPAVGHLEPPHLVAVSSSERPLDVAKQFTFQQPG